MQTTMTAPSVFISADIEGVSGWIGEDESTPDARAAMVGDVNAAIEGALEAAPDASVTVADAHGDKRTIPPRDLHQRASLLRGDNRPYGMVDGADEDTDLAFFVGYHDRPGSGGFLEHTYTGAVADVRLGDHSVGELELNAMVLADLGVPVALVTGDDHLADTVADRLPSAEYVTTKTARSGTAAICRPQTAVRADIREAAAAVTRDPPVADTPSVSVETEVPTTVTVEYRNPVYADIASLWPGVDPRDDSLTVAHETDDVRTAYQFVRAAATVRPAE